MEILRMRQVASILPADRGEEMTSSDLPIRICGVNDLPAEGQVLEISAGGQSFCVARLNGKISALANECPHHGGPLGEGTIENGMVVCPWHAYGFDVNTGACLEGSAPSARVFPISIADNDVLVEL
jgi:nitrite reductase (NADH) small subunit